jgi:ribosomal protein S12
MTLREQVLTIGSAIGRPLRFEETSPEVARREMRALMTAPIANMLVVSKMGTSPQRPSVTIRRNFIGPRETTRKCCAR